MILGTRARPRHDAMKRTTSMTEFSYDDLSTLNPTPTQPQPSDQNPFGEYSVDIDRKTLVGLVSPRLMLNRRNSADFAAKPSNSSFLRTCSLCRRRLTSGRDIFMYRGDTAFCSLECRQQQMAQDEWKEKCEKGSSTSTSTSNKETLSTTTTSSTTSTSTCVVSSTNKAESVTVL